MSCHGKLQTLKNGTADSEIQLWAYQQIETIDYLYKTHDKDKAQLVAAEKLYLDSFERGKQIGYAEGMMNRSISVQNIEQFTEHEQENKMNTEPVAWMLTDRVVSSVPIEGAIPLYTHPAKTLTDEEIEQVRVAIMGTAYWCADENMSEAYNAVKVCCGQVLAILRKAEDK